MKVLGYWFEGVTLVICYGKRGDERMALVNLNELEVWDVLRILKSRGYSGFDDTEKRVYIGPGKYALVYTFDERPFTKKEFFLYDGRFFATHQGAKNYYKMNG